MTIILFVIATGAAMLAATGFGLLLHRYAARKAPEQLPAFWLSIYSSLLVAATVGLLLIGFQTWQEEAESGERSLATRQRLVDLVSAALKFNLDLLERMSSVEGIQGTFAPMIGSQLRTDFWDSIVATGDVREVTDLDTLNAVSSAYEQVRIAQDWDRRILDGWAGNATTIRLSGGEYLMEAIIGNARAVFRNARPRIETGIAALEEFRNDFATK